MPHLPAPRLRPASWARTAAVAVAVLLVCWLVVARSTSAFSGTTDNPGNALSAGTVTLTDDDEGAALFTADNLRPGSPSIVRCIEVEYTGTLLGPGVTPVKLYGSGTTTDLAPYVLLEVAILDPGARCGGTGGTVLYDLYTPYTGPPNTMTDFLTYFGKYDDGLGTGWTPTATDRTRAFAINMRMDPAADNAAQSKAINFTFTWEVRSS